MNKEDLIKLFQNLNIWARGEQRAPHKPLLLLYALGKCLLGADRLIPYHDIDSNLRKLLIDFGPPRKSFHPEYPFWRLQNDGLWELDKTENLVIRQGSTDAKAPFGNNFRESGMIFHRKISRWRHDGN